MTSSTETSNTKIAQAMDLQRWIDNTLLDVLVQSYSAAGG